MSTFALDVGSSTGDIITGINYALANLGQGSTISSIDNVLVANIATGEITTTTSNSGGYTSTTVVSYLYQYMNVKYANTSTGSSGFSGNSTLAQYYGLRNTSNVTISNNPTDYVWYQVSGGFGTTKSLWYQTIGGRQIAFFAGNAAPQPDFIVVPDDTPLNLDSVTSVQNNQIVNVNAYYQANTAPATPAGGTYNFATFELTPPATWSSLIPEFVANTSIYVSQTTFVGNSISTVGPAVNWTTPVIYSAQFNGNTGAPGQRGFVPLGFVVAPSDPTVASDATLTTWFSSSRANASPPIGLGYAPIAGDTAQFFYKDNFNPNNDITIVKEFDGTVWTTVTAEVVSGGLIVPGTITANTLNANQIYAITIQSTNAEVGNIASPGYWLQANTGSARFGGDVNIGANLTVAGLITLGGLNAGTVGPGVIQANVITGNLIQANTIQGSSIVAGSITADQLAANVLTVGNIVSTGATFDNLNSPGYWLNNVTGNVRFGGNTSIGNNLAIGNDASIGGNLTINGLLTNGSLVPNVVATTNLIQGAVNQTITATDNSGSNLLSYAEGDIPFPAAFSYWPSGTRGFAIQANLTPQSNTSTIVVSFSCYVNSTANSASNCVEVWRSGNSNIALATFNTVTTLWPTSNIAPTATAAPYMMAVGSQGQGLFSNDGGTTWSTTVSGAGTSNFNTIAGAFGNVLFPNLIPTSTSIFRNAAYFNRAGTGPFYTGNANISTAGFTWGNAAGDISSSVLTQSTYSQAPVLLAVNPLTGNGQVYAYDLITTNQVKDISQPGIGTVNGLAIDITARSSLWNTAAAFTTPVRTVVVGTNKQIAYRDNIAITSTHGTRFSNTTSTLNTAGAWTLSTVAAPTSLTPNPDFYNVASNATTTTRANTWVAVGTNYYQASPARSHSGIWNCVTGTNLIPSNFIQGTISPIPTANIAWTGVAYGNGAWVTVSNVGTVAYSTNATSWTYLASTPATQLNREINDITFNPSSGKFVAIGNSLVMSTTVANLAAWTSTNVAVRSTGLTRLQYYGSWYDPGRTDIPLSTQQLVNGSVVSGTAIDTTAHSTLDGNITYYLVAGNLSSLQANTGGFVYVSNPALTITEQKR